MKNLNIFILAAGKGTRMNSTLPKILHPIAGEPMVNHVIDQAKKLEPKRIYLIVNKELSNRNDLVFPNVEVVIQKNQNGTADAIEVAKKYIKTENFIILFGDVPLITDKSLKKLIRSFKKNNTASMIAFKTYKPKGYGRVVLNNNKVTKVVEEINTSANEKIIELCNSGIMLVKKSIFYKNIKLIKFNKKKKERYLTDIFEIYFKKNIPFSFVLSSEDEMSGVNNLTDFNKVDSLFQNRLVNKFLEQGVLIKKPETSYFSYNTKIDKKVIIEPNVVIRNNVSIKSGSIIKSYSDLDGVLINEDCSIGPHARIRPYSIINKNSKIGNYVEIKNSSIGKSTSISHLAYIGDSKVGNKVNIGAGCITCNYDGVKKSKTIIGDNSFIGSNTSLIAPVKIGNNVKIGAGSVINKDISANKLAIRRSKLKIY